MLNIPMLTQWIEKGYISPLIWRVIEASIISGTLYVLTAIMDWSVFSWQALVMAIGTPILFALNKAQRDAEKRLKKELENDRA